MIRSGKTLFTALLVCGGLATFTAPAAALTIAPTKPTVATASGDVQLTGWRCGPGRHLNRWGRCVRNY